MRLICWKENLTRNLTWKLTKLKTQNLDFWLNESITNILGTYYLTTMVLVKKCIKMGNNRCSCQIRFFMFIVASLVIVIFLNFQKLMEKLVCYYQILWLWILIRIRLPRTEKWEKRLCIFVYVYKIWHEAIWWNFSLSINLFFLKSDIII